MRIAVIDAEIIGKSKHRFPNLCCMKLSAYHKGLGDAVELKLDYSELDQFDKVYISKVFTKTNVPDEVLTLPNVTYGGTGFYYDEAPPLSQEVEHTMPDYHLYDGWIAEKFASGVKRKEFVYYLDYSIGFLTRGCHMGCWYCVNKNSKASVNASPLSEFMDESRPKLCFLDDNFFACKNWKDLIAPVVASGKRFQFKQGLNERSLTAETIKAITAWKYDGEMIFAFDSVKDSEIIERKLQLIYEIAPDWNRELKFYVFCGGDEDNKYDEEFWENDIRGVFERIRLLAKYRAKPYIMRFEKVYKRKYSTFYAAVAAWCNQPSIFYSFSFRLFAQCRGMRKNGYSLYKRDVEGYLQNIGVKGSEWKAMEMVEQAFPNIAETFFDFTPGRRKQDSMGLVVYDCEVFAHDWLVGFKDKETGHRTRIWNDNEAVKACLSEEGVYAGFNSKHYDQYIVKAIVCGCTPQEVKQVNDFIIGGKQGWEHPLIRGNYYAFNNVDIKDDMQMGLSLKAIEGHIGMSVQESNVPFDIDRPLTEEERREVEFYNDHDIDTTERLVELRKDYLKTKIDIGRMAGISDTKAMSMTNAKLTSALLSASPKEHDDERQYQYPECLKKEYIPPEVFEFFEKMYDPSISDKELFSGKLAFSIGDCPGVVGYGGIHAAIPNHFFKKTGKRVTKNLDVASYYPHLMTLLGYTSRNIPSPDTFKSILETRMEAKAKGDKTTANALKLVTNTTYGTMLNKYNDLYDPLMGRSVCISGQLLLLELAEHLYQDIPDLKVVQLNTDGIMIEIDEDQLDAVHAISDEWQARTGFELEEDSVAQIAQKDVNNYLEVQDNGEIKLKGGYLVRGMITDHSDPLSGKSGGGWNVNNNARIVAMAIKEYFVNGTPVEETVGNCDDIFQFQIIAKAGVKYREAYHVVGDKQEPVQKVNRVYATSDEWYGKLFKVKAENDSTAKIEMLPEHCIIDNDNKLTMADVDKTFYIEMAKKRINDFMGIKPEKPKRQSKKTAKKWDCPEGCTGLENYGGKCPDDLGADEPCPNGIIKTTTRRKKNMATATKIVENVYQKLLKARLQFLQSEVQKTGKNMHLSFKYFELDDIVPTAIRIFEQVGLIPVVSFTADTATMKIINIESPDESVSFLAPFDKIEPIVSATGNKATNEMQALGSSITYMRRYLYMIALDICESDSVDNNIGKPTQAAQEPKKAAPPATPQQREETKKDLTKPEGNASDLQIKQLKAALKKLKDKRPEKEEMIAKIAVDTQGFTVISKTDCENILTGISKLLEAEESED